MSVAVVTDVPWRVPSNGALLRARGLVAGLQANDVEASLVRVPVDQSGHRLYHRHKSLSRGVFRQVPELEEHSAVILCGIALAHGAVSIERPVVLDVCDSVVEAWGRRIRAGELRATAGLASALRLVKRGRLSSCMTYVTEEDLRHDRRLWRGVPAQVVPNGVDGALESVLPVTAVQGRLGFVADLTYRSNQVALEWILSEMWQGMSKEGWTLSIFGPAMPSIELPAGVEYRGFLPSIVDVYGEVDVTIAPSLDGAGFKNKVAESLAACRPVVTTPLGARGQDEQLGLFIEETGAGFVNRLRDLRPDKIVTLSAAMDGSRSTRSWGAAVKPIVPVLTGGRQHQQ